MTTTAEQVRRAIVEQDTILGVAVRRRALDDLNQAIDSSSDIILTIEALSLPLHHARRTRNRGIRAVRLHQASAAGAFRIIALAVREGVVRVSTERRSNVRLGRRGGVVNVDVVRETIVRAHEVGYTSGQDFVHPRRLIEDIAVAGGVGDICRQPIRTA